MCTLNIFLIYYTTLSMLVCNVYNRFSCKNIENELALHLYFMKQGAELKTDIGIRLHHIEH